MTDLVAIRASAKRIIEIANAIANPTRRHDLVVEAAAIIRLCDAELPKHDGHGRKR